MSTQFESPEFASIVDDIVAFHTAKIDEYHRRDALVCSYRDAIRGNPAVLHIDRERINAVVLEAYQQAARRLGYDDIDFPKEAERLSHQP